MEDRHFEPKLRLPVMADLRLQRWKEDNNAGKEGSILVAALFEGWGRRLVETKDRQLELRVQLAVMTDLRVPVQD